ncbi:hypothetical protein HDU96_009446 [Phlyctochytrium bullatum]|nr:hypothetical protein HDU96_009446 [Phlyctochytrium bullatum]
MRILPPGTQPTQSSGSAQWRKTTEKTEGQPSAPAPAEKAVPESKPPATYARAVAPAPNATPPVPLTVSEWPPLGNPKSQQNAQATATAPVTAPVVETTSANQEETSCAAPPEEHHAKKHQAEQTCGVAIGRPPLVPAMKHGAGKRKAGQKKQKGAAPAPALETSRSKKDSIGRVNFQTIESRSATAEQIPDKKQGMAQPQTVEPTRTAPSPERIPANMDASKETGLVSGSASDTRCVRVENLQALQAASVTPERPLAKHEVIRREVAQTYEAIEHQKRLAAQEIMRNVTARAWKTDSFVDLAPPNQVNLAIRRTMLDRLTRPAPVAAKNQEVILDRLEYFLRMLMECNVGIFRPQKQLYHSHQISQRSFDSDPRMHQDDPRSYYQDPRLHQNDPRYFNNDSGLYQNGPRAFADDSRIYQGDSQFYTNGNQQQWEVPRQPRNAYMSYPPGLNVPIQYPPGLNVPMQRQPGLNVPLQYPPGLNPMRGPMNQF